MKLVFYEKSTRRSLGNEKGFTTIKRLLSLIMVLAMILTLMPTVAFAAVDDTITVYFRNDWLWPEVYVYYWAGDTNNGWPGETMTKVDTVTTDAGDRDVYSAEIPTWANSVVFNGLQNDNSGNRQQTPDVTGFQDGDAYYIYWDSTNQCGTFDYTPSTGGDEEDNPTGTAAYEVTFHFANNLNWTKVNLYTWIGNGVTLTGGWPGTAVTETDEDGYYVYTLTYEADAGQGLNFIFNDGSTQTVDLSLSADAFVGNKAEKWVVLTTNEGGKYNADILDGAVKIISSPVVEGTSVTFAYQNDEANSVSVAGTLNGWSTSANPMSKDEDGIWTVTIDNVTSGVREYKFMVDETNWVLDPVNTWIDTEDNGNQNSAFQIFNSSAEDKNEITVRFHYSRTDGNYDGWNMWIWTEDTGAERYDFVEEDGEMIATFTATGREVQTVWYIVRHSTEENDWAAKDVDADRSLDVSGFVSGIIDCYLTAGTYAPQVVYGDDVLEGNKISNLELDYDNNAVSVTTIKTIEDPETELQLLNGEEEIPCTVTSDGTTYTLKPEEPLSLADLYQYKIHYDGYDYTITADAVYASDRFAEEFTYTGNNLGATWSAGFTTFRVWAPTAVAVSVNRYQSGTAGSNDLIESVEMTADVNGTWVTTVEGDLNGTYYTYSVTVNGELSRRLIPMHAPPASTATAALSAGYNKAADPSQLVIWAESHDTYADGTSSDVSEANINKTWALVAACADAMSLYLARPESMEQALGTASVTGWANAEVKAVNEFHNAFVGQSEVVSNEGNVSYVERGTTGVVLVNVSGAAARAAGTSVSVTANAMADGSYTDQITGNTFTVTDGKITGEIGATGIAVVYNAAKTEHTVTVDNETPETGDTVTITAAPNEGKAVDKVTVTDKDGKTVTVTDKGDGTYTYVQPDGDVTVKVSFKDKPAADTPATGDNSQIGLWIGIMAVTVLALVVLLIGKRKKMTKM